MPSSEGSNLPTYVALLRAINLGSRNKVAMADLRALFVALGSEDVATYVQSGNVVFTSRVDNATELAAAIEEEISRRLGLGVKVLVRTSDELANVVAGNPFADSGREPAKLHVTFLSASPDADRADALAAKDVGADEFHVAGREVYLYCPDGYGRTKLTNAFVEKQFRVVATTRNWKTVTTLADLARA